MILAIDVYYKDKLANVVGVLFDHWDQPEPSQVVSTLVEGVEDYQSGSFYKRELPCILKLINELSNTPIDCIIVDGYVYLDRNGKKGLGYHLYEAVNGKTPIIGVAKTYFHDTDAIAVCRGDSKRPLYITAIGIDADEAARLVTSMAGSYRFPALLKFLDQQTKEPNAFQDCVERENQVHNHDQI